MSSAPFLLLWSDDDDDDVMRVDVDVDVVLPLDDDKMTSVEGAKKALAVHRIQNARDRENSRCIFFNVCLDVD